MLCDPAVEAVVIATPPETHHAIVKRALQAGKHVLVEKPLATRLSDAQELAELARESGLVLMPGHTFIYSPAVNAVRDLIQRGVVGDIHFVTSSRMNLASTSATAWSATWRPTISRSSSTGSSSLVEVSASGSCVFHEGVPETAFLTLTFASGDRQRAALVAGAAQGPPDDPRRSKRMVQYDDTAADEPVRVYDRGMDVGPPPSFGEHQLICRTGDVVIPRVEAAGAARPRAAGLRQRDPHRRGTRSSLALGLEIVAAIEMAEASMRQNGVPLEFAPWVEPAVA